MNGYIIAILLAIAALYASYAIADAGWENWKETRIQNEPV